MDKYVNKAFVSTGFNNWKKAHERFKLHSTSNCHRESVIKISQIKSAPDIGAQLDKQLYRLHIGEYPKGLIWWL